MIQVNSAAGATSDPGARRRSPRIIEAHSAIRAFEASKIAFRLTRLIGDGCRIAADSAVARVADYAQDGAKVGTAADPRSRKEYMIRLLFIGVALALAACAPALADETPFAAPPISSPLERQQPLPSLPDIMGKIQFRHIKAWYAMKSRNWALLEYELERLRDSFESAVVRYRNIPIELIVAADKSLAALQGAAKAKDEAKSERSYEDLTAACNGCHRAAQVGFILIKTPSSYPFSDQEFSPRER